MNQWLLLSCLIILINCHCSYGAWSPVKPIIEGKNYTKEMPVFASICFNGFCVCGGAFLTPRVVVTAAHCLRNPNTLNLYPKEAIRVAYGFMGDSTKYTEMKLYRNIRRILRTEVYIPEDPSKKDFFRDGWVYDLGIIILEEDNEVSKSLKVVDYPTGRACPGDKLKVYGYGLDENGYTGNFKKAYLNVTDDEKCKEFLDYIGNKFLEGNYGIPINIPYSHFFCASSESESACVSDSGSPVVAVKQATKFQLKGVVSMGKPSCRKYKRKEYINIYINIHDRDYQPWIKNFMELYP